MERGKEGLQGNEEAKEKGIGRQAAGRGKAGADGERKGARKDGHLWGTGPGRKTEMELQERFLVWELRGGGCRPGGCVCVGGGGDSCSGVGGPNSVEIGCPAPACKADKVRGPHVEWQSLYTEAHRT